MSAYSTSNSPSLVQVVGLPAQRAADDLLAQQLGAEGAHAEDVGDGVGVPALGQHGDRDDAADRLAEAALAADRVHHFAQEVFVGERLFRRRAAPSRCGFLALELFDLRPGGVAEVRVERFAGLHLLAVDQQRVGPGQTAAVLVVVAEQLQVALVR